MTRQSTWYALLRVTVSFITMVLLAAGLPGDLCRQRHRHNAAALHRVLWRRRHDGGHGDGSRLRICGRAR